ncbi:MAG: methionine--tRNA ligase [Anaerolineaceae bacterium 4572_78]|nr:MAG: methionine--tRNA ligase [Anaerolineaceae bacterium 4572_78]
MSEHILVCTAWPYANGDQHLGHMAGNFIPADIFARYHRLKGNKVLMVSGSDTHGTPITVKADAEGISPKDVFERYHLRFLDTFINIGISYDMFTHTDTESHHMIAQDMFKRWLENGYLYKEVQQQYYSLGQQRFLPDRYIEGTCPKCDYESARGDQCDNCGTLLDPIDLIEPHATNDDSTLELRETEHYFLDLAKLENDIAAYLNDDKEFWRPNVINFSRSYVEQGLKGRPITRDIKWGVHIPVKGYENKRLYVWAEAVMGYLTACIEWAENQGTPKAWHDWWYHPKAKTFYFMGKDNIPFHSVIWPAELISLDRQLYLEDDSKNKRLNLPFNVVSNEYLTMEGTQLSTSRNYAVWTHDMLERYDPDPIRYCLNAIAPESRDTDFSFAEFVRRNNNELVATWGNLVNRVLGFAYKRFDKQVPLPAKFDEMDKEILAKAEAAFVAVGQLIESTKLRAAQEAAFALARATNVYFDHKAPWKTFKTDKDLSGTTIYVALKVIDSLKILLAPFLPFTCQTLHELLGYEGQLFGTLHKETVAEANSSHVILSYDASDVIGKWQPSQLSAGQPLQKHAPTILRAVE